MSRTVDDIIFEGRLKAEKQVSIIRVGLVGLLLAAIVVLLFNTRAIGDQQSITFIGQVAEFAAIALATVTTVITFILLKRRKYSIVLSYIMVTVDLVILSAVNYALSLANPNLPMTTALTTAYSIFIVLSGMRYSFGLALYTGIMVAVGYAAIVLVNGWDVVRVFGHPLPVFTGAGNSGKTLTVYFDMDDIVIRSLLYVLMGVVVGIFSRNSRRLILDQQKLADKNDELRKSFVSSLGETMESSLNNVGLLEKSVGIFNERIAGLLASLDSIAKNAREQNEHISGFVERIQGIDESFGRVDGNISEQSLSVKAVSERILTLTASIGDITRSTQSTNRQAKKLTTQAHNGSDIVGESITAVRQIEMDSREIEKMIAIINDIAERTKVLSINAGIEASNVGAMGKGFSIIAAEIRKLADSSASSANHIKDIVGRISKKISHGVALSENVGSLIVKIIEGIDVVGKSVQSIAQAAESQAEAAGAIEQNIGAMVEKSEQIRSSVSQEKKLSGAMVERVREIKKSVEQTEEQVKLETDRSRDLAEAVSRLNQTASDNRKLAAMLSSQIESFRGASGKKTIETESTRK